MFYSQSASKIAVCALALAACAPGIHEQDDAFYPAPRSDESTVVVRNDYIGEMDVYAVLGSMRTRIGAVTAGTTANFRLPRMFATRPAVQFQLDPVGPAAPFTYQPIPVGPGNVIELTVAPTLQMSSYAIVINR